MTDDSSGFLLGLSTGVVCLAYCGPVLIPYLMGEGRDIKGIIGSIFLFLAGRLLAYLLVGVLSGIAGNLLLQPSPIKPVLTGIAYCLLSVMLILYGFHRFREICLGRRPAFSDKNRRIRGTSMVPVVGGFATGLNLCPPFLLAITGAMDSGSIAGGLWFFFLFFLGTTLYFIPLPFIGFFRRQQVLRVIGKFAAIIAGTLYLYKGIVLLL
jgi:sulfite exporter TauE/SafE